MSESRRLLALVLLLAAASAQTDELPLQDPTRPYVANPAAGGVVRAEQDRFELTAVLISEKRRIAVINGSFYREGDRVNGELITGIEPGAVRVKRGEQDVLIRIVRDGVVTTSIDGEQGQ